jgi:long-chain acyl-CoA synthetase
MTLSNSPGRAVPVHQALIERAAADPSSPAVVFHEQTLTFADLEAESNRLTRALRFLGLEPGDRVGLFLPNCPQFVAGFYAASKLGAIVCPLNSSYREREIVYQLNDSGAKVLLTHAKLWQVVEAARGELRQLRAILVVSEAGFSGTVPGSREQRAEAADTVTVADYGELVSSQASSPPSRHEQFDPDQLVALPYSSGTTGLPKGVMLTHRNLVSNHEQLVAATQLTPKDSYIVYMPLSHIMGIALMGAAIRSGAKLILLERFDLEAVTSLIEEHRVTWLFAVPPVLLALADSADLDPSRFATLKYVFSAAAPLAPDVARRVEARLGVRVHQGYGLTEAGPATHHSPLAPELIRLESGGVPVADTEQRIVDLETGERRLAAGEIGEICVRGPQVMQGYWNAPDETARALRGGWLYTGDTGWIDEDGYLYIVDRKKEMIKYRGFSIAPAELEAVLLEHPDVADCGVTGVTDVESGEVPKAFVVVRAGTSVAAEELAQFVAARVAGYKQVRYFEFVDSIPRTPSGKILRRMLKQ